MDCCTEARELPQFGRTLHSLGRARREVFVTKTEGSGDSDKPSERYGCNQCATCGEVSCMHECAAAQSNCWAGDVRTRKDPAWHTVSSKRATRNGHDTISVSEVSRLISERIRPSSITRQKELPPLVERIAHALDVYISLTPGYDARLSEHDAAQVGLWFNNPRIVLRQIEELTSRLERQREKLVVETKLWRPLCIVPPNEFGAGTCFMDWDCTKETDASWWGFTIYFCDTFGTMADCKCKGWEITWVDLLLIGFAIALLRNPAWIARLARWLASRGAAPIPLPTG